MLKWIERIVKFIAALGACYAFFLRPDGIFDDLANRWSPATSDWILTIGIISLILFLIVYTIRMTYDRVGEARSRNRKERIREYKRVEDKLSKLQYLLENHRPFNESENQEIDILISRLIDDGILHPSFRRLHYDDHLAYVSRVLNVMRQYGMYEIMGNVDTIFRSLFVKG